MTVDPEARKELFEIILDSGDMETGISAGDATDAIIAAGWAPVPPGAVVVQTEGEEWEAMVERGLAAYKYADAGDDGSLRTEELIEIALRAAITPKQETSDGE